MTSSATTFFRSLLRPAGLLVLLALFGDAAAVAAQLNQEPI